MHSISLQSWQQTNTDMTTRGGRGSNFFYRGRGGGERTVLLPVKAPAEIRPSTTTTIGKGSSGDTSSSTATTIGTHFITSL